jgi:transcription antitermination factor NusG
MFLESNGKTPWWVVHAKRHKERAAEASLVRAGLVTYLPLLLRWPRPVVGSAITPMFPGYVFVQVAPLDLHRVGRCAGVHGLVTFGGVPPQLDDAVIVFLRDREGRDGIIRASPLAPGSEVVITEGPLRGVVAVLERRLTGRQRVLVLLDILQRSTRVEMPAMWVRQA